MDDDATNNGMDKYSCVCLIEVFAQLLQECWQFFIRGGRMNNFMGNAIFYHHLVICAEPASIIGVVESLIRHQMMDV